MDCRITQNWLQNYTVGVTEFETLIGNISRSNLKLHEQIN